MYKIKLVPDEFQNRECGYRSVVPNPCTPRFEEGETGLRINGPRQMIRYKIPSDNQAASVVVRPYLPICFSYKITTKRLYKHDKDSDIVIYIKNKKDEHWSSGVVRYEDEGNNIPGPDEDGENRKFREEIENAQNYPENALDNGPGFGAAMNLNVLDYVAIQLEPGEYEMYLTNFGLQSNHIMMEVVIKDEKEDIR